MSNIKLREFLKEGAMLKTRLNDCAKWVANIVQDINEDCIEIDIGLERDYIDSIVMTGDTLKCKFTDKSFEYNILGWIRKIRLEAPPCITIRVHKIERFENVRDSERYDIYLSSVIKKNKSDAKGLFAVLTNISKTGAAFIVKDEIENQFQFDDIQQGNYKIFLEIYITNERQFHFEGLLVRRGNKEKGIEYGIRFVDLDDDSQKGLNQFLDELANKDKEFYNKRSSFWSKNSNLNK